MHQKRNLKEKFQNILNLSESEDAAYQSMWDGGKAGLQ